ncbi:putative transporter svop-1 [Bombyx mori]|uniref:Major facilitator superfamily (MFS) profile domain-containing protein n=1 Tax=Bombyx mori TaxID=7091 RepID=A0A8R2QYD5_BOMMO|nr:putative transporter svop-1 [Bombyx mori]XP_037867557.1 putative transporter svop-1 [Bombyx mori]
MAFIKQEVVVNKKCSYDTAMDLTGFGIYNIIMLTSCCLIILAMYMDIFGFSVVMPAVACDMDLTTAEQGLLSAIPLIGVMFSSYVWGFCADTRGRRTTLLFAMPVGSIFGFAASMAPSYISLAILKFLSASFTSSANAAAFVLVGESTPKRHRSRFMFLLASATMCVQFIICSFALPVFKHSFYIEISWLHMEYRPWRMLMQIISIPGVIGTIAMAFLNESPKFLLSRDQTVKALDTLKSIYRWNTGRKPYTYPVSSVYLDEEPVLMENSSFFRKMWDQTAPLFKPPLLKNSLMLYYILMCAYMTSTGYTMWVPTMTNAYFSGGDKNGLTFCEVASNAASATNSTLKDCDNIIQPMTLYAVMCYSGVSTVSSVLLSFAVGPLGKKLTTLLVFAAAAFCGVLLLFVRIPMLSIALFFLFLYVALILGNVNSYLVEWNPTHLRGMATCLSVVVARGFGFISVQLIASLLTDYCTPMISGYVLLVISGFVVSIFLPPERKPVSQSDEEKPIDQ